MRDGPRRFPQNSSCSAVLRCRLASSSSFRVRDYHPLWCQFPQASATLMVSARRRSYNPGRRRIDGPGLGYCAFARHYLRNHCYFLLLRVLRCFSSPGSPTAPTRGVAASLPPGFPIRTSAGHRAFAPHRGFSQLVTSFLASESHRHPPCALSVFPCVFKSAASARIAPRRHALSSLLDLLNLSRSIALSTRFLRFDFKTLARRTLRWTPKGQRRHTRFSLSLYSSRSQHVNDLISLSLRSPRQT